MLRLYAFPRGARYVCDWSEGLVRQAVLANESKRGLSCLIALCVVVEVMGNFGAVGVGSELFDCGVLEEDKTVFWVVKGWEALK